jgi:hypothetical protein
MVLLFEGRELGREKSCALGSCPDTPWPSSSSIRSLSFSSSVLVSFESANNY